MRRRAGAPLGLALALALVAPRASAQILPAWLLRPTVAEQTPNLLGARGGLEAIRGDATYFGAAVSTWQAGHDKTGLFMSSARIGGGSGIEGALAGDFAIGTRVDVAEDHGPFLRGGVRGFLEGSDRLTASFIEVPTAYAGYQYLSSSDTDTPLLFELGGRAGFGAAGRFVVPGARRVIRPALETGAHASVGVGPAHLELDYSRVGPNGDPRSAFETATGALCGHVDWFGACVEAEIHWAEAATEGVPGDASRRARAILGGFTLGVWL
jgi:hypothetical protein